MLAVLERQYAVIAQSRRAAPNYNITMSQRHPLCLIRAEAAAEEKNSRQT